MTDYYYKTTPNGNDWDVKGDHAVQRGDRIHVTGDVPRGIHIWHPGHEKCMCAMVILNVHCNGLPHGYLNIVQNASHGRYYLATTRPTMTGPADAGVITGEAGILRVGSTLGGGGDDPHRHR